MRESGEKIARKDVALRGGRNHKKSKSGETSLRTLRAKREKKPRSASTLPGNPLKNTPRAFTRSLDVFFHVALCASYPIPSVVWSLFFPTNRPRKGTFFSFFKRVDERNARETTASRRANDRKNGRNAYLDHFCKLFCILRSFVLCV